MPIDKEKSPVCYPSAEKEKKKRPRKVPKPIEPFTAKDFELTLRKVLRPLSEPSQSDSAKK